MNISKISVRYAKAVFLLAKEKNILDAVKDDMLLILKVCNDIPDFTLMLYSPVIQTTQKLNALNDIFKGSIHDQTSGFLALIVRNKREQFVADIIRVFMDFYRHEMGIKAVSLTTAIELAPALREKIIAIIRNAYNSKVELTEKVRPEIIGGFILTIDDKQMDTSVSSQLKELERQYINTSFEYKILG
ncbi:MAG: ATP synthase F1 subunit delta [Bacteroidota bacterium]